MTAKNVSDVFMLTAENGVLKRTTVATDLQVGYPGQPGELHVTGRFSQSVKILNVEPKKTYTLDGLSTVICLVTKTGPSGVVTISLPSTPRPGQVIYVKDASGTAGTNNIVLVPPVGTIQGTKSKTLDTAYDCYNVVWTGSEWVSIAGAGTPGANGVNIASFYFSAGDLATYYISGIGYVGYLHPGGGSTLVPADADISKDPALNYIGTPVPYACRITSFSVSHTIDTMPEDITYRVYVNGRHQSLSSRPTVNFPARTTARHATWTGSLDLVAGDVISVVESVPTTIRPTSSPSISAVVTFRQT